MHPITYLFAAIGFFGFTALSILNARHRKHADKNEPAQFPGPALVPWIGRVHDLPIQYMWLKFKEWADTYGPIYRTQMLGANFLVISDEQIAEELLVKRAKIYSDRPVIRSLFDSKSTHGSMEYLPLMGKNGDYSGKAQYYLIRPTSTDFHIRILVPSTPLHPLLPYPSHQRSILRRHDIRSKAMAVPASRRPRRLLLLS